MKSHQPSGLQWKKGGITFTYLVMVEQLFVPLPHTNLCCRRSGRRLLRKSCVSKRAAPSFCAHSAPSYKLASLAVHPFAVHSLHIVVLLPDQGLRGNHRWQPLQKLTHVISVARFRRSREVGRMAVCYTPYHLCCASTTPRACFCLCVYAATSMGGGSKKSSPSYKNSGIPM